MLSAGTVSSQSSRRAWTAAAAALALATGAAVISAQNGYNQPGYNQPYGNQQPGYGQQQYGQQPGYGDPGANDPGQGDPPSRVARVSVLQGNVSLQPSGVEDFSQASMNYPLTSGDRLYTDNGAIAELEAGQLALRLGSQTDLSVTAMTDTLVQFGLGQGSVHLRNYDFDPNATLELDTPNGAVTMLGPGDVRVDVSPDGNSTQITLLNGQARVDGEGIQQMLQPGQSLQLSGTSPVYARNVRRPRGDALDSFSSDRDRIYQSAIASQGAYVNPATIGAADLGAYGDWSSDNDYGSVWYPRGVSVDWQPYSFGHWAYIAPWGWTWVENEPWGFAPFHYGRWARFGPRWGWIPGPAIIRPVYSPALVVFVGGGAGVAAWFPLGPREPFVPWYRASALYTNRVNVTNIYNRNTVEVRNIYNQRNTNIYVNMRINNGGGYRNRPMGTIAVPQAAFAGGRPVHDAVLRGPQDRFAGAPVLAHPGFAPTRGIMAPGGARALPPRMDRPFVEARRPQGEPGSRNGNNGTGGSPGGNGRQPGNGNPAYGNGGAGQPGYNGGRPGDPGSRMNSGGNPGGTNPGNNYPGNRGGATQPTGPAQGGQGYPTQNAPGQNQPVGNQPRGNQPGQPGQGQPGQGQPNQPVGVGIDERNRARSGAHVVPGDLNIAPTQTPTGQQPGQGQQPAGTGNGSGGNQPGFNQGNGRVAPWRGNNTYQPPAGQTNQSPVPAQPVQSQPMQGQPAQGYGYGGRQGGQQPVTTQPVPPQPAGNGGGGNQPGFNRGDGRMAPGRPGNTYQPPTGQVNQPAQPVQSQPAPVQPSPGQGYGGRQGGQQQPAQTQPDQNQQMRQHEFSGRPVPASNQPFGNGQPAQREREQPQRAQPTVAPQPAPQPPAPQQAPRPAPETSRPQQAPQATPHPVPSQGPPKEHKP